MEIPNLPKTHRVRSNVFFYFLLCLTLFWDFVVTIISIVLQAFKLYYFFSPKSAGDFSMVAPFLWFFIAVIKYIVARDGNRSEHVLLMLCSLVLMAATIILEVYFILWQPYLWSWEAPLHYVSIALDALSAVFAIVLLIIFAVSNI
ncbi:hypothetical protein TRFO_36528 [Tritrichomonas foetus]|uniref:Transmembrane protein n=1 Tax=Tritrichomonas foetus TaxID=1144522 RepID=A0A1J4JIH2_9EUKA|nr:hypothetical protein TRFO_36528 [Tritrichomonas foetus]|eukprot:OHS97325.1 hypothetical protein TRFO_36528 [Tritrichomonas foetus]